MLIAEVSFTLIGVHHLECSKAQIPLCNLLLYVNFKTSVFELDFESTGKPPPANLKHIYAVIARQRTLHVLASSILWVCNPVQRKRRNRILKGI